MQSSASDVLLTVVADFDQAWTKVMIVRDELDTFIEQLPEGESTSEASELRDDVEALAGALPELRARAEVIRDRIANLVDPPSS